LGARERIGFPDDKLVAPRAGDFYVRRQKLVCRAAQGLYLAAAEMSAGQLGGNCALRKHGRELIEMRKIKMDAPLKDLFGFWGLGFSTITPSIHQSIRQSNHQSTNPSINPFIHPQVPVPLGWGG
jgi:hypothetical protein